MKHYENCTDNYPEKPVGEKAQMIMAIDLEDGNEVCICADCGAFEVRPKR